MERFFDSDSGYEKWARKAKEKGNELFYSKPEPKYLRGLKGRVQNNLSGFLKIALTALIFLVQCILILLLPGWLRNSTVYFYFILELVAVVAVVTLVNRNQSPAFQLAWISIVLLLPISGFVMYYLWGRSGGSKARNNRYIRQQISYGNQFLVHDQEAYEKFLQEKPVAGRMVKYMETENFPLSAGNSVKYYSMGEEAFEDIFAALEQAKSFILMDFFIVAEGALWDKMHEILKRKCKEGVEIKFLYDDFGTSIRTRKYFRQILQEEGMEVRVFNPIRKYTGDLYVNYRSHQKIVVVDGEIGFTGGFNLADEYANLVDRFGVWKDTGVCVHGEAVWNLTIVFLQMWESCGRDQKHVDYLRYRVPEHYAPNTDAEDTICHVIYDGPVNHPRNLIEGIYNQMIMYSDQYLYITTPYLIIEEYMMRSLIEAVKRGVDVRIITPGIPDKKMVKLLSNYHYGSLLQEGVRIYEYAPGFIHAKQILTDDAVIVGTINMDYRSFYLHYENGIWMSGERIQETIRADFINTFEECQEITYEDWLNRPWHWKVVQPLLKLFSTLV